MKVLWIIIAALTLVIILLLYRNSQLKSDYSTLQVTVDNHLNQAHQDSLKVASLELSKDTLTRVILRLHTSQDSMIFKINQLNAKIHQNHTHVLQLPADSTIKLLRSNLNRSGH